MTPQEFAWLQAGIRRLQASGFAPGAVLATLTRTFGPTFRRTGARMLVFGDGSIVRGLSGGCPEADIVERAARVIADDRPELVRYHADDVFDPMAEMGCGGDIEVLIEPLVRPSDVSFLEAVEHCLNARDVGWLATAFARDDACLMPRPLRRLQTQDAVLDELDDAALSQAIAARARPDLGPVVERFPTAKGAVDVLIEPLQPPYAVVILGITAVSRALARLAVQLGWTTILVDPREDRPAPAHLPAKVQHVAAPPRALRERVRLDARTSAVVMSHKLDLDVAYLEALRDAPVLYLGAMGSRPRVEKMIEATGLSAPRLHAPSGLDVGSETPEEIALAIAAEILATTTGHAGGSLSATDGPIH